MEDEIYDLLIIGAGPAGMSACIYSIRYKLNNMIISKDVGGTTNEAHMVENYPGYKSITGFELMQKFKEHVDYLKGTIKLETVTGFKKEGDIFEVITMKGSYKAKALIIAGGSKRRYLNVEGEQELRGKGVSYCATCDAFFFKDKVVGVVGGNDSAASAAITLSAVAKKVYIIYRKESIRAEPYWIDLVEKDPKIEIINNAVVKKINGTEKLESVSIEREGEKSDMELDGLFIEIGSVPPTDKLAEALGIEVDERGYIKVDASQKTNIDGIFAAGDITTSSNACRQIVTGASEGAIAAMSVFKWFNKKN